MRIRKLLATATLSVALAAALMLSGCWDSPTSKPDDETNLVRYAKVYTPDGVLLVEGECTKVKVGNGPTYDCDIVAVEINGIVYRTSFNNVVVMSWYE